MVTVDPLRTNVNPEGALGAAEQPPPPTTSTNSFDGVS